MDVRPSGEEIRSIRRRLNMSQKEFATAFYFEIEALENWEQGRRKPGPSASMLLRLIERYPQKMQQMIRELQ